MAPRTDSYLLFLTKVLFVMCLSLHSMAQDDEKSDHDSKGHHALNCFHSKGIYRHAGPSHTDDNDSLHKLSQRLLGNTEAHVKISGHLSHSKAEAAGSKIIETHKIPKVTDVLSHKSITSTSTSIPSSHSSREKDSLDLSESSESSESSDSSESNESSESKTSTASSLDSLDFWSANIHNETEVVAFNLEEIYKGRFYAIPFNGTWISEKEILYDDDIYFGIVKFNVETQEITTILAGSILEKYISYKTTLSVDHSQILIGYAPESQYRHSERRKYDVYDLATKKIDKIADGQKLLLATWGPLGNSLVYVLDNDLYYREVTENGTNIRRLTYDGINGEVFNGIPDWVYEEEVTGGGSRLWFSSNGQYLAFGSFNDTEVHEISYPLYGEPGDLKYQYPTEIKYKYPKAGTKNPKVSLNLIDLWNGSSKRISLKAPIDVVTDDNILHTVSWFDNKTVAAVWSNRIQNVAQIVSYDVSGKANNLLKLEEEKGWVDIPTPILHDYKVLLLKNQESNTMDGKYLHVTSYDLVDGITLTNEKDLSPLASAVQSSLTVDSTKGTIYYLASVPGESSQKHLYSTPVDGSEKPCCISCNFVTPEGNNCSYVDVSFSTDASYYAMTCLGPDPTTVEIYNREHEKIYVWQENEYLRNKLKFRQEITFKTIEIPVNGFTSRARLALPPNFDETKSYPMIVQVYAGPNTAAIKDISSFGLYSYFVTNRSVIWTVIDGRGSAYRGSEMLYSIYRSLGTVEVADQIAVTQKLQETYSWIDANRTGIWGWSYGGFVSAMVLATDKDNVFTGGISVAPVSSWIYYDSIYTERYMGLPTVDDNLEGYKRSDVNRHVEGILGKKYLLIHGTSDDNVHYQQSMALSRSLALADIPFEQKIYPDEAHGLVRVTSHLAHAMDTFWEQCLQLTPKDKCCC